MAIARLPLDSRPLGSRAGLQRWLRLILIELRFSHAALVMPLAVVAAIWFFNSWMWQPDRRWDVISSNIAQSVLLIGPAGAMWATYVAQREGRSRLADLTASLPIRSLPRHLLVTGTPVLGSVLAYALGALVMMWWHGRDITWGEPDRSLIGFGALVVLACAMIGAASGRVVQGRFAPVVVSGCIFLYFVMSWSITEPGTTLRGWALLAYPRDRMDLFSPLMVYPPELTADEAPLRAGVAICLTVIATALAVLVGSHGRLKVAAPFALAALIGFVAAAPMTTVTEAERAAAAAVMGDGWIPVENPPLVCAGAVVTTCLHQIDSNDLDRAASAADGLLGPLQGLPGVPSRIEMRMDRQSEPGVLRTGVAGVPIDPPHMASIVIPSLFDVDGTGEPLSAAEQVIAVWLMRPVASVENAWYIAPPEQFTEGYVSAPDWDAWLVEIESAADRFAALPPEEQRAWLEANWDALRAGELALEDLP